MGRLDVRAGARSASRDPSLLSSTGRQTPFSSSASPRRVVHRHRPASVPAAPGVTTRSVQTRTLSQNASENDRPECICRRRVILVEVQPVSVRPVERLTGFVAQIERVDGVLREVSAQAHLRNNRALQIVASDSSCHIRPLCRCSSTSHSQPALGSEFSTTSVSVLPRERSARRRGISGRLCRDRSSGPVRGRSSSAAR